MSNQAPQPEKSGSMKTENALIAIVAVAEPD